MSLEPTSWAAFAEWAWARHHNEWSWYVRPLFLLPFAWFAWRRQPAGLLLTLLLLPTSLFWFPAPSEPAPRVLAYLAWERAFVLEGQPLVQGTVVTLVLAFLVALAAAFWTRRWWWGLVVLNVGTLLKLLFSVAWGGQAGRAVLVPALVTLAVCHVVVLAIVAARRQRAQHPHWPRR